eukprot:TRINITY_DN3435_c0_g1_i1.p1 TRINITY_DN3435_c0_g1~~TRINITY_DN3435_c0_g1_i1.p1  ORF type:complete len:257 (+),score=41.92 TRINITY_DN3435_c0_g1_i1:70-840(+)
MQTPESPSVSQDFVGGLIEVLNVFVNKNTECDIPKLTPFWKEIKTKPSIESYVLRINKHTFCEEADYLIALMLLDRLSYNNKKYYLTPSNFYTMFGTALVVAIKSRQDLFLTNTYYASVLGISLKELNYLERHFLTLLQFEVHVETEHFSEFSRELTTYFNFGDSLSKHTSQTSTPSLSPANSEILDDVQVENLDVGGSMTWYTEPLKSNQQTQQQYYNAYYGQTYDYTNVYNQQQAYEQPAPNSIWNGGWGVAGC